jgi:DNA-binding NarL/FixJ family response regulator
MPPIRLLIADDHMLMREGLRTVLSSAQNIEIVGEARAGRQAIEQARRLSPDVILMDLNMPGMNGVEATREILREQPAIRIVALSAHLDETYVAEAAQAGVAGIWAKDVEFDELVRVIHAAHAGERPMHPTATKMLAQARRAAYYINRLSRRERDVLLLIGEGLTNREIAARLNLSEATVKGHVSHILAKLGLKNRAQLALYVERSKDR